MGGKSGKKSARGFRSSVASQKSRSPVAMGGKSGKKSSRGLSSSVATQKSRSPVAMGGKSGKKQKSHKSRSGTSQAGKSYAKLLKKIIRIEAKMKREGRIDIACDLCI